MQIELRLFGHYQLTLNDVSVKFATDHVRALLAYLAVEARIHERATLAALLWPEQAETAARQNLRQALVYLKQALYMAPTMDHLLEITAKTIRFHPELALFDIQHFRQLWRACTVHSHVTLGACPECIARLQQMADLYRGDFLQGFFVKNSAPFEEWALYVREQLHRQALEVLDVLTRHAEARADHDQMQSYAARQLALEPWREEAHRQFMRALALRGQGSAALAHYLVCQRMLAAELGAPPSSQTVQLYEQIKAGAFDKMTTLTLTGWPDASLATAAVHPAESLAAQPSTHPGATVFPHNLTANLGRLVGRAQQLQLLYQTVLDPGHRLVTLVGMGGMGKTRLALALMEQLIATAPTQFRHGAWFVPLVGVAAIAADLPQGLATAIVNALEIASVGQADAQQHLFDYLAARQLLLVLDNFEHLLLNEALATTATGFLLTLFQRAPGVTVLITSRMALHLAMEEVIRLQGLLVPDSKAINGTTYDSVSLFVQQAQRLLPNFTVDEGNLPDVIELCRLVNGMPLGIELAATLAPHFTGAEMVAAIRENLAVLVSARRDIDERHRRLTAVFDYSWQLLSLNEQRLLAQSTIFVGRFSRVTIQTITGAALADLISLVDKSLIQQPAAGLYELHELLRQFTREKVSTLTPASSNELQVRYLTYHLGFIAERAKRLRQRNAQAVVSQIQQASEDCRQAWQMALTRQSLAPMMAALDGWLRYWRMTGRYQEGETLVGAAIAALELDATALGASVQQQRFLGELWLAYADCLYGQNKYKAVVDAVEKALTLAQRVQDEHKAAHGLAILAEALSWQGRHAEAQPFADRAYILARQHNAWEIEIRALITLAWYYDAPEQRFAMVTDALRIAQHHDDPHLELSCMQNLAGAYENEGYYAHSLPYRTQSLHLAQVSHDRYQIGEAYYLCGLIHAHLGVYGTACEHFQRALTIAQEHSFIWLARRSLNRLAVTYVYLNEVETAAKYNTQARQLVRPNDEVPPFFDFTYGQILVACSRWTEAKIVFFRLLTEKRERTGVALTSLLPELAELARLALQVGDQRQALIYAEEIFAILHQHPHFSLSDVYFNLYAIYLACYQVLQAENDERASTILEAGYQKIQEQTAQMSDVTLRHSYVKNVLVNRDLIATRLAR